MEKTVTTKRTCEKDGHLRARGNYCVFCNELVKPTESEEKWNAFYEGIPKDIIPFVCNHFFVALISHVV